MLLAMAVERLGLSARAYHRVLKLARTCAALVGAPDIRRIDVAEAVKLRALEGAISRATPCSRPSDEWSRPAR
jgi:magnesium chelatase family protein